MLKAVHTRASDLCAITDAHPPASFAEPFAAQDWGFHASVSHGLGAKLNIERSIGMKRANPPLVIVRAGHTPNVLDNIAKAYVHGIGHDLHLAYQRHFAKRAGAYA